MTLFDFPEHSYTEDFRNAQFRLISYETAQNLIEPNHYLHSMGSTVVAIGMFLDGEIVGAVTYGTIPSNNASGICGVHHAGKVLELTRLYLHEWAGTNAESTLIAASFRVLEPVVVQRDGLILISYADSGAGHVGTVYQATNWIYTGVSIANYYLINGTAVHSRTASDSRKARSSKGLKGLASTPKHRYVMFLGDRRQVRWMRRDFKWQSLPYPKHSCGAGLEGETSVDLAEGAGSIPAHRS